MTKQPSTVSRREGFPQIDPEVLRFVDKTLERIATEDKQASERIKENIKFKLPYLADLYDGCEAIAVAEMGSRYLVVDSGDKITLEKRMEIRTSSTGDLGNLPYEIFNLEGVERRRYTLKFLGTLARLNDLRSRD